MKIEEAMTLLSDVIIREQRIIDDLERLAECAEFPAKVRTELAEWAKNLSEVHYSGIGGIGTQVVWHGASLKEAAESERRG